MSSSNNREETDTVTQHKAEPTGSESLYPDSVHVRCVKGTVVRVRRAGRASSTSASEWLRRAIGEALDSKDGGAAPSTLAPSAETLARMRRLGEQAEDTSARQAFPEDLRTSCPSGTKACLEQAARKRSTSRSEWVRRVVVRALEKHEAGLDSVDR